MGPGGDGMSIRRVVWCHNIYIMRQSKKKKEKKKPCAPHLCHGRVINCDRDYITQKIYLGGRDRD